MKELRDRENIFFVGIGGIGMSALALYFLQEGYSIAGYDRTESRITKSLAEKGCLILHEDNVDALPARFRNLTGKSSILVIYTPAIPSENRILSFFRDNGYRIFKRSEILGEISYRKDTIAVAGTHGKTTVSAMTAHLLKQSAVDCTAFLGGIMKNYDSNFLAGKGKLAVIEADEFDRSFHRLSPSIAVITSLDADHLDVYGDHDSMINAYKEFCLKIKQGGKLLINSKIKTIISPVPGVGQYTYGFETCSDYYPYDITFHEGDYIFDLHTPEGIIKGLHFPYPGIINIENLTAAIAVSRMTGVTEKEIRKAITLFKGVRRRFDIRFNQPGLTYIDDYAHHPEEIRAFLYSVREYFPGRRITGIFQPHLYSRTRDHSDGFASVLDQLDEVILLPVYPAREKPIPGISSEIILRKMKLEKKRLLRMEDLLTELKVKDLDVLITIGAGDIDSLAGPIEEKLKTSMNS